MIKLIPASVNEYHQYSDIILCIQQLLTKIKTVTDQISSWLLHYKIYIYNRILKFVGSLTYRSRRQTKCLVSHLVYKNVNGPVVIRKLWGLYLEGAVSIEDNMCSIQMPVLRGYYKIISVTLNTISTLKKLMLQQLDDNLNENFQ